MGHAAININNLAGLQGGEYHADTSAHTAEDGEAWFALKAIGADAVFAAVTSNITSLGVFTLAQGDVIYGSFTSFTLTSGAVVAYDK